MAVKPGFQALIKIAAGSTALTGEGLTDSGDGLRFYMTDAASQPLDPETAITVYDNASPVAASGYEVNYLMGWVTFASAPTGPVTLDGAALDLVTVAKARQFTFTLNRTLLDDTVFGDEAVSRKAALKDTTVTFSSLQADTEDLDPGAGTTTLADILADGTIKLIDIQLGTGVDKRARAFVMFDSIEVGSQPNELTEWTISANGALPGAAKRTGMIGNPRA